jgi:hypothetical protein
MEPHLYCFPYDVFHVARILVSWNWIWWPRFMLCSATTDLSKCTGWCAIGAPLSCSQWNALFDQCKLYHICSGCCRC